MKDAGADAVFCAWVLQEVQKKFGTFPFSLRQLEDERDAKSGVVECVRGNVFRQYELVGDKDGAPVARLLTTIGEHPIYIRMRAAVARTDHMHSHHQKRSHEARRAAGPGPEQTEDGQQDHG